MSSKESIFHLPSIVRFLLLILAGALFVLVASHGFIADNIIKVILLVYTLAKSAYFLNLFLVRVKHSAGYELNREEALRFILFNVAMIIVSATLDYAGLYKIDHTSFVNIDASQSTLAQIISFFYFSVSTFTTTGFGDISAKGSTAQLLVSFEMLLSWILTIMLIANFVNIRESYKQKN